jgi:hypothetical protein
MIKRNRNEPSVQRHRQNNPIDTGFYFGDFDFV